MFYRQLREKTTQTLRGASKISPRAEWEFVIQNARLYDRMGCDLLALDLGMTILDSECASKRLTNGKVCNWEFLVQPKERSRKNSVSDPRKMLRRRSSLVIDDLPTPGFSSYSRGLKSPPQKVFEEPDSSDFLNNFGF